MYAENEKILEWNEKYKWREFNLVTLESFLTQQLHSSIIKIFLNRKKIERIIIRFYKVFKDVYKIFCKEIKTRDCMEETI